MTGKKDDTPVEPLMARKKSSQSMMAIGWVRCPCCNGADLDCKLCWDDGTQKFLRRVPVDKAIAWKQQIGLHDTEPEMEAVHPDTEPEKK